MALYPTPADHRPVFEVASDAHQAVAQARETGRPMVLTTEGREVAVLLSVEVFEAMRTAAVQPDVQRAVDEAERGLVQGRWVEHSEVEARLKRWAARSPGICAR